MFHSKDSVFADVDVSAHDGAGFAGAAEAEFTGRVRADAGEIDGHVAGAGDAVHVFVEGFVEDDADVGGGARDGREVEEQAHKWQGDWHGKAKRLETRPNSAKKPAGRNCGPEFRHAYKNPGGREKLLEV